MKIASNFFLPLSQRTGKNKESKESTEKEKKKKLESTSRAQAVQDSWLTKYDGLRYTYYFCKEITLWGFNF